MSHKKIGVIIILGVFALFNFPRLALAHQEYLTVRLSKTDGTEISSFKLPTANLGGGASLAVTDLGVDGTPEIIVGMGLGNEPRVYILRQDGSEISSFLAYATGMGTGITVEACDINNDGINEIVTGTQYGGGPHVRVFDNLGNVISEGFFAYNAAFRGGVNLACGDVDNDGTIELVTTPGPSGGPHARIWSFKNNEWKMESEFFVLDANNTSGLAPIVKSDGQLVIAAKKGSSIDFVAYDYNLKQEKLSTVFENKNYVTDVDELGEEIIFSLFDKNIINEDGTKKFLIDSQNNGSEIATADLNNDEQEEIISIEARPIFGPEGPQYILVDLSEQRLYAYENGVLTNTFLVSTAKYPFVTPAGIHSVLAKKPIVDYTWSYGEGNPNNYSLGPTPWNLNFYGHFYIHYAFWHNNFGHPMSHGCINVNLTNIKWLYDWANVGIPVEVRA
ncbi:MAG: L,D-transpeptidase family protein [Patescibacteria group bacterium]|jgi:lipoprotein-anchoring transpeptidase ErfK/SrfK